MANETKRGAREGLGFGIVAGVIFALMEIFATAIMGDPALVPLQMFASIVLGEGAFAATAGGGVLFLGILVHLVLSAAFGLTYGLINAQFNATTQTSWGRQVWIGLAFGFGLWLVNFQIIARIFYPWFLGTPQFLQLMLHALSFGLPLALMYAGAERREHHVGHARHA